MTGELKKERAASSHPQTSFTIEVHYVLTNEYKYEL
jgi:hypothetical protein